MNAVQSKWIEGVSEQREERVRRIRLLQAYGVLMKPRIAALLVFTALCSMETATGGLFNPVRALVMTVGLGLCAGGAAAVNMWYDRDIDAVMERTADRPIPAGIIKPGHALTFGIGLGVVSVILLGVCINGLTAALAAAGYLYYAVVYTMFLKRRTPQNIVIGGGAGAFPPLVGWAAAAGHLSWSAVVMFAVIFLWTPSHFWGLALVKNEDYRRAVVPMMPAVRGGRTTKHLMTMYALMLFIASLSFIPAAGSSLLYAGTAIVLNGSFLYCHLRLSREPDGRTVWAKRTFLASLIYLPILFIMMAIGNWI